MAIEHALADGHEEAPDEDVLLASGYLDVLRPTFAERDLPCFVINVKVKVGVAAEIARNCFVERQVFQTIEESGVGIQPQMPD